MKFLGIVLLMAVCSVPCLAQYSKQLNTCLDTAMTQSAITLCASEEAKRADSELDDVYRNLFSKDTKAASKISAAKKAWIAYRDALLEAIFPEEDKQAAYGSKFAADYRLALAQLTRQQIVAIKALIEQQRAPKD